MSFLLDQLKKSGRKRQIELAILEQMKKSGQGAGYQSGPEIKSVPESASRRPKIQRKHLYLLLVMVVIFSGVFFWWKKPVLSERQDKSVQTTALKKNSPVREDRLNSPVPDTIGVNKVPAQQKTDNRLPDSAKHTDGSKQKTITEKHYAESRPEANIGPLRTQRVVNISELPLSVRNSLPEIKISSHLYKKDSPLVSINGRIMTEGYNVTEGLYLEEITPEGVILSYRNYRFSVKAQ